jgi:hypothetical protein
MNAPSSKLRARPHYGVRRSGPKGRAGSWFFFWGPRRKERAARDVPHRAALQVTSTRSGRACPSLFTASLPSASGASHRTGACAAHSRQPAATRTARPWRRSETLKTDVRRGRYAVDGEQSGKQRSQLAPAPWGERGIPRQAAARSRAASRGAARRARPQK